MRSVFTKAAMWTCRIAIVALTIFIGCDCDKPEGPVEWRDYDLYFADQLSPNMYYRYNTGTRIVDSIYLPFHSYFDGFGISPDGKTMYLHPDNAIAEVSLDSNLIIIEHPIQLKKRSPTSEGHEVIVSPDGRYLALLNWYLHIIRLADYSIVYADTVNHALHGWFSRDSRTLLCALSDTIDNYSYTYVLEVSLGDSITAVRHQFEGGSPSRIVATPGNRQWCLLMYYLEGYWRFRVYDMPLESLLFHTEMCPGFGDLEITRDGRYVFYSQPGSLIPYCPPPQTITIYDVLANRIDTVLNMFVDTLQAVFSVSEMCITPDGRHLIGISSSLPQLFDYDPWTKRINGHIVFGEPTLRLLHSLSCQTRTW